MTGHLCEVDVYVRSPELRHHYIHNPPTPLFSSVTVFSELPLAAIS